MARFDYFQREIASAYFTLFVAFGIIFPFASACSGKYHSVYFSFLVFLVIRNGFVTLLNFFARKLFKIARAKTCSMNIGVVSLNPMWIWSFSQMSSEDIRPIFVIFARVLLCKRLLNDFC